MTNKQRKISNFVNTAINNFNENEQYLISRDLSEQCICAKFMSYLERTISVSEFHDYFVDVEYNRGNNGNEYAAKELHGRKIVVDLIVHKRGYDNENGFDNLVCIEMKKAYRRRDIITDKRRLRMMTDNYYGFNYKAGFMIIAIADRRAGEYKLKIDDEFYNDIDD